VPGQVVIDACREHSHITTDKGLDATIAKMVGGKTTQHAKACPF
jgi:hypothetical protein